MAFNAQIVGSIFILVLYVVFITFIIVGGGFITNVLFNSEYDTGCVGIDTRDKKNIAKMSIVMFWMVFIPLCLAPFAYFGYKKLWS